MNISFGNAQQFSIYRNNLDGETSIRLAKLHLDSGDLQSVYSLLLPYSEGDDPEVDYLLSSFSINNESEADFMSRRLELLTKSAERSYPPSLFALAQAYDAGEGVSVDKAKAAIFFERAAEAGHAHSQWILSLMFLNDVNGNNQITRGVELLFRSADQGFSGALNSLSTFYNNGEHGFPINNELSTHFRSLGLRESNIGF